MICGRFVVTTVLTILRLEDYVETVRTRASESIVFGLKSPEKPCKSRKKSVQICLGRRCRRFESCHSDQKSKREEEPLSCFFDWCVNLKLFCEAKCRFAFPARRSTSSLVRQRAWESRSVAKLPCHSDQIWLWEAIPEAFFFVSSDANFEGWRLFSSALAFYHLDKLELV